MPRLPFSPDLFIVGLLGTLVFGTVAWKQVQAEIARTRVDATSVQEVPEAPEVPADRRVSRREQFRVVERPRVEWVEVYEYEPRPVYTGRHSGCR